MLQTRTIKKLLYIALYTSPAIAGLIITPIFILKYHSLTLYGSIVLQAIALILLIWLVNILLTWLISRWQTKRKARTMKYIVSYLFGVVFIKFFIIILAPLSYNMGSHDTHHFHMIIFFSINTIILIILDLVLIREKNTTIETENAQLKMKNLETINEQLKQKIHPHFLFNSLSTLKTLIARSPKEAEGYLLKLSDFLRTSITSGAINTMKIADEIRLCIDYLDMQKIRFGEALQFTVNIPESISNNYLLPVFALQTLAENAIKHNALTVKDPLYININYTDGYITISNNLQLKDINESPAGTGLVNLNERYKILSNEDIIIKKERGKFSVSIKILDNENSNHRG